MRVLVAEDNLMLRQMLQELLTQWGFDVVAVQDGSEAWDALSQEDAPQLVVLDWMMPGMEGIEICRRLRQRTAAPYVYVILLTAKNAKEEIIEGHEAGADDYVTKPFDASELQVRLRVGRRILELQAQLLQAQEALREQAARDPLTGVWNHAMILDILGRELNRAGREHQSVGVVMADLDHFKAVNDTYGHVAGDAVLCEVAHRLCASIRSYDAVGRYGGEEFLLVLPGCDLLSAHKLAQRVHAAVGQQPIQAGDAQVRVTMSLGVTASGDSPVDAASLVRAADAAAYLAKHRGRNRVEVQRPDLLTPFATV